MLKINNTKSANKYNGQVVVTDEQVAKIEQSFASKFAAFSFGIEQGWTKKCIMKFCLGSDRDQYFYNYYAKWLSSKK